MDLVAEVERLHDLVLLADRVIRSLNVYRGTARDLTAEEEGRLAEWYRSTVRGQPVMTERAERDKS